MVLISQIVIIIIITNNVENDRDTDVAHIFKVQCSACELLLVRPHVLKAQKRWQVGQGYRKTFFLQNQPRNRWR